VLVVDDQADLARSLARLLKAWGHEVHSAHDGPAALEAAQTHRPEVVLLDVGLPGMDGYEVARRLRGQWDGGLRIVALTGYGQEEDRLRSRAAGFDDHLVKPVDPDDLSRVIERDPPGGPDPRWGWEKTPPPVVPKGHGGGAGTEKRPIGGDYKASGASQSP
jgi:CheY-like chemotaxis protein